MKTFLIALLIHTGTLLPCVAQDRSTDSVRIENDVDRMLSVMGGKFDLQPHEDRIAQHGAVAVPILIRKYGIAAEDKRWALVACLCKLPTDESRMFLAKVIREHTDRKSTPYAISQYPIEHEAEIAEVLIEILPVHHHGYEASERLRMMIFRNPSATGQLIKGLGDEASAAIRNQRLYDILEHVSGYANSTLSSRGLKNEPDPDSQNKFWQAWWVRNNGKEVFEWLHEALYWKHGGMRDYALQILGTLNDRRAIPVFIEALDDRVYGVRYWAVVGLRKLDETYPPGGYLSETFKVEERDIIAELKARFGKKTNNKPDAGNGL